MFALAASTTSMWMFRVDGPLCALDAHNDLDALPSWRYQHRAGSQFVECDEARFDSGPPVNSTSLGARLRKRHQLIDDITALDGWENFYVIVGSSAGALIGLQFVVLTLIAERPTLRAPELGAAFATPSVVHFAVVLFLSAIASAPWNGIGTVSVVWGLVGVSGIAYAVVVARRMRVQTVYRPVFEDWLFHVLLPFAAYVTLAVSAYAARSHARPALFVVGAATLLLLFVGIHNAWDAVTYQVFVNRGQQGAERNR